MNNLFEAASRKKIRFNTLKGSVTAEDLWDIPLIDGDGINLDDIAKSLYRALNTDHVDSFVLKAQKPDEITQLKFDIVTHIIKVRLVEKEKAEQARVIREKKQRILSIIAKKEDQALEDTNLDDLRKMLEEL